MYKSLLRLMIFAFIGVSACTAGKADGYTKSAVTGGQAMTVGGKSASQVFSGAEVGHLAEAACRGDLSAVNHAIAMGADPNAEGLQGITPLFWALQCENADGVAALLKAGADPNHTLPGDGGFSPVFAAAGKDPKLLKLLLAHKGDPNAARTGDSWTALIAALYRGMDGNGWENYYALLDAGADINLDHSGTIAEREALLNQFGLVSELLDRGYSHDLQTLGLYVTGAKPEYLTPQQLRERDIVQKKLESRGIVFPVTSAGN